MKNNEFTIKEGENAMSADNQQERLDGNWISGFVDGEGCFHVAINKIPKMTLGWQPDQDERRRRLDVSAFRTFPKRVGSGILQTASADEAVSSPMFPPGECHSCAPSHWCPIAL